LDRLLVAAPLVAALVVVSGLRLCCRCGRPLLVIAAGRRVCYRGESSVLVIAAGRRVCCRCGSPLFEPGLLEYRPNEFG
jgi:hypothetical protein